MNNVTKIEPVCNTAVILGYYTVYELTPSFLYILIEHSKQAVLFLFFLE